MNFKEIPAYIINHNSVVAKILKGESNWSAAELQHYQNYPSEVEKAIKLHNSGVSVSRQGCVYQSQRLAFKMSWENYFFSKKTILPKRQCNAVAYIAMALTYGGVEKKVPILVADSDGVARPYDEASIISNNAIVAVAIVDNDNVDVAVVEVGDGVVDVKGVYGGKNISLDMACDMAWGVCSEYVPFIERAFLVGNRSLDKSIQRIIYNHFHTYPECFVIYHDLLELSSSIYEGVLQGTICNLLMCDVLPMPVGIRISSEVKTNVIPVFEICWPIPTKKDIELSMKEYTFPVQIEFLQGDFKRSTCNGLWELRVLEKFTIGVATSTVNISIDVGSDGLFDINLSAHS